MPLNRHPKFNRDRLVSKNSILLKSKARIYLYSISELCARRQRSTLPGRFASTVPNVRYRQRIGEDCEENSINVRLRAVKELPYLKRKTSAFWSDWTSLRKLQQ